MIIRFYFTFFPPSFLICHLFFDSSPFIVCSPFMICSSLYGLFPLLGLFSVCAGFAGANS